MTKKGKRYRALKRTLDILLSLAGIIFCSIFLWWWIFVINIFVASGRPIFRQSRLGKGKKVFNIIKFRSMKADADPNRPPHTLSGEELYKMETNFGRFLRRSQLDETLQLFNILLGEMSFVGPRPGASFNEDDLVVEREKYTPNAYDVRPGLTGYAQIELKDKHNPSLKAAYDCEYVKNISFGLDAKIFFVTVIRTFGLDKSK